MWWPEGAELVFDDIWIAALLLFKPTATKLILFGATPSPVGLFLLTLIQTPAIYNFSWFIEVPVKPVVGPPAPISQIFVILLVRLGASCTKKSSLLLVVEVNE